MIQTVVSKKSAVGLRRTIVVTEKATDALTSPNAAAARLNSVAVDQFVAEPLMVAFAMIMDDELRECTTKVPLTERNHARFRHSSLTDRTNRSACALQCGGRNGVRMMSTPDVASRCRTPGLHFRSRSQIRKPGPPSTPSLWINLVVAITLALPLAFEAPEPDLMKRPPRAPDAPLLSGFLVARTF
jgi:hypothetical protein